jgi:hypothetical protein
VLVSRDRRQIHAFFQLDTRICRGRANNAAAVATARSLPKSTASTWVLPFATTAATRSRRCLPDTDACDDDIRLAQELALG